MTGRLVLEEFFEIVAIVFPTILHFSFHLPAPHPDFQSFNKFRVGLPYNRQFFQPARSSPEPHCKCPHED